MATENSTQKQINKLKKIEADAKKAYDSYVTLDIATNPTPEQFTKRERLRRAYETAKAERERVEKPFKDATANLKRVRSSIKQAERVAANPASRAQAERQLQSLRAEESRLTSFLASGVMPSAEQRPGGMETAAQARAEVARQPTRPATAPAAGPAATPTGGTPPPAGSTKGRGGKGTAGGAKGTAGGTKGTVIVDGERVKVGGDRWKEIIQEEFGSLWDVYSNNADVRKVIDRSVQEGWYNDPTKLTESLRNTNWFRTTESKARQFAIRQSTDPATLDDEIAQNAQSIRDISATTGVVLSDTTITRLASDKVKYGWTENELSNAVGSEVVATARAGGAQGMAELTRATYGSTLRQVADSYAVKPTDSLIEQWTAQILSGSKTQQEYENLIREQARTLYRSLAPQIDKGLDVKTAVSAYTNQAQRVLGVDETQIDWTDNKWNRALNYQDPKTGEYRQMDTWEWNRYLRSMPEWQDTDDAKQLYRSAAFTLAQAFGRTT